MKHFVRYLALAACALALGACATGGTRDSADAKAAEVEVEDRAIQRWEHLIAGQGELAWDYLTPGARSTKSREAYGADMRDKPVKWKSVEFDDKNCDGPDKCTVRLLVEYSTKLPLSVGGEIQAPALVEEQWLRLDGVWYHLPSEIAGR